MATFIILDTILTDLDIAPASTLFLDLVEYLLWDYRLVVALCGVTIEATSKN